MVRNVLFSESGQIYLGEHAVSPTRYSMTQLAAMSRVPMALLERLKPGTRASALDQTFPRGRRHEAGLAAGNDLRRVTSDRFERVRDPGVHAVEATDCQDEERRKTHRRTCDWLDGTDPDHRRRVAVYQASDNPGARGRRSLAGIGTRCSY